MVDVFFFCTIHSSVYFDTLLRDTLCIPLYEYFQWKPRLSQVTHETIIGICLVEILSTQVDERAWVENIVPMSWL